MVRGGGWDPSGSSPGTAGGRAASTHDARKQEGDGQTDVPLAVSVVLSHTVPRPWVVLRPQRTVHFVPLLMLTSFFPDFAKMKELRNPKRHPAPNTSPRGHGAGSDHRWHLEAADPRGPTFRSPWAHGRAAGSVHYAKPLRQTAIKYVELLNTCKSLIPSGTP